MKYLKQSFNIKFEYKVYFTSDIFNHTNNIFGEFLNKHVESGTTHKILFVIDDGVLNAHPELPDKIKAYFQIHDSVSLIEKILVIAGGESAKNNAKYFDSIVEAIDTYGIDRHSYIAAIGGGSVLDLTGFAAAVSHRGIKHIRIPTTVLSQNDSGVGVKNGINFKGKKNFIGTFSPPVAVFNDDTFLSTLSERDWRSGIAEAIKVALVKDADFFYWIEENVEKLNKRDIKLMKHLIRRSAELHLQHIASSDPFELGSSRPLDFGHWSAHKLEQLSDYTISHGEAVAMGIALDTLYSVYSSLLSRKMGFRIIQLLMDLGFEVNHPLLQIKGKESEILKGLQEFREHLGGRLTIMLLTDIGHGQEVHEMSVSTLKQASIQLEIYKEKALIIKPKRT